MRPDAEGISYKPSGDKFVLSILLPYTSVKVDELSDDLGLSLEDLRVNTVDVNIAYC